MKTPDQVLSDKEAEQAALEPAPSPARAKAAPTPEPVAEEVSVPEPAPAAPAAPPAPAAGKKAVAQEVAAATAAVTAEIEQKLTEDADTYQFPPLPCCRRAGRKTMPRPAQSCGTTPAAWRRPSPASVWTPPPATWSTAPRVTRYEFALDQGVKLSQDHQPVG